MNTHSLIALALALLAISLVEGVGHKHSIRPLKGRAAKAEVARLSRYLKKGSITPEQRQQLKTAKNQLKHTAQNTQAELVEPHYLFKSPAGKQQHSTIIFKE